MHYEINENETEGKHPEKFSWNIFQCFKEIRLKRFGSYNKADKLTLTMSCHFEQTVQTTHTDISNNSIQQITMLIVTFIILCNTVLHAHAFIGLCHVWL